MIKRFIGSTARELILFTQVSERRNQFYLLVEEKNKKTNRFLNILNFQTRAIRLRKKISFITGIMEVSLSLLSNKTTSAFSIEQAI